MSNKGDMPYTNAFIQEIYRYRTLAPLAVPHKATADTEINGYVIPKNTQVNCKLIDSDYTVRVISHLPNGSVF